MTLLDDSISLLRALAGPHGIHASLAESANYRAIFTRDATMAGIAGLLIGDRVVTAAFVRTLEHLRDLQGAEGQIASNYLIGDDGSHAVSFGTLAPRLDGPPWFLVGVAIAARAGAIDAARFRDAVQHAVRLLDALEYNGRQLIYVPTGGDWADEWIYEGYVLHDQVLRAWALRLLGDVYDEPAWRAKSDAIGATIAARYWPAAMPHPIAAFTPARTFDMFDLAACSLLALSALVPDRGDATLDWIDARFLTHATLPPAFHPAIEEGDADWPALRRYHLHGFRNRPHEYHNGGVWPIWLGWLALALAQRDRDAALARLRTHVHDALASHAGFAFEEYLHGVTGAPGGTRRMAYSATGIVFLHAAGSDAHRRLLAS